MSSESSERRSIVKLEEAVINRIAAGEVVQRPSAAVKELLENCLDAGSTQITVTAAKGGLKLLQVTDNGHGIRSSELGIVCERFTTSKLRTYEDLREMTTFGFRGEALASITHVAHVSITSKTKDSPCAYRAYYSDGCPVHPPGTPKQQSSKAALPKPCAGVTGTTILVEDLFFNMPTRQRAFKQPSEEHAKVLEVVTRYAIHNGDRGVGFTCKKQGSATADIHCPPCSGGSSGTLAAIRIAYGPTLARELLPLTFSESASSSSPTGGGETDGNDGGGATYLSSSSSSSVQPGDPQDSGFSFTAKGFISNANYSTKRAAFLLFINDRLVESTAIRRCIDAVYKDILPNHMQPFVYLALQLPPKNVDVNVHPTKREVHFLNEDRLLRALHGALQATLRSANQSRAFVCQTINPGDLMLSSSSAVHGDSRLGVGGSKIRAGPVVATGPTPDTQPEVYDTASEEVSASGGGETKQQEVLDIESFSARQSSSSSSSSSAGASSGSSGEAAAVRTVSLDLSTDGKNGGCGSSGGAGKRPHRADNKLVRADSRTQSLDGFLVRTPSTPSESSTDDNKRPRLASSPETDEGGEGGDNGTSSSSSSSSGNGADGSTATAESCVICPPGAADISAVGAFARGSTNCNCRELRKPPAETAAAAVAAVTSAGPASGRKRLRPLVDTACSYESVQGLIAEIKSNGDRNLTSILKKHVFVGLADQSLTLVQWDTKLLLVNHVELARELFFQIAIRRFGCMARCTLTGGQDGGGLPVEAALLAALDIESVGWTLEEDGPKVDIARNATLLLLEKAPLLDEYFKLKIVVASSDSGDGGISSNTSESEDGPEASEVDVGLMRLVSVPVLLEGHVPEPSALPLLLLRLASEVDWDSERACFEGVAIEVANAYSTLPEPDDHPDDDDADDDDAGTDISSSKPSKDWAGVDPRAAELIQHVMFPAFRQYLIPPHEMASDASVMQIACLEKLYKVFERC